jgi:hypothetical protein
MNLQLFADIEKPLEKLRKVSYLQIKKKENL